MSKVERNRTKILMQFSALNIFCERHPGFLDDLVAALTVGIEQQLVLRKSAQRHQADEPNIADLTPGRGSASVFRIVK